MDYLPFLTRVHELLGPDHYLEIGVRDGTSLALASCRSLGIDPDFNVTAELDTNVRLVRTTSDEYFTRPDPLAPTAGEPFDLAFIDGMHLFEFALRDFINTERHSRPSAVVVFDDMLPRSVEEAARDFHTSSWTGDVYSVVEVLARYRPDLSTVLVNTEPTGLLLVTGLDPANTTLADRYDDIIAEYRRTDPQPVPQALIDRAGVQNARRVLEAGFWQVLREQRGSGDVAAVQERVSEALERDFGAAYGVTARVG